MLLAAFQRLFDDPAAMRLWFADLITYSEALTLAISGRQLEQAGVIDGVERRFSVDETVRRHKPAPEAYHSVAHALEVAPGDICLIACHVWDMLGALAAGWQAGLVLREGNAPLEIGPQPTYVGDDLDAIADQLIDRFLGQSDPYDRR